MPESLELQKGCVTASPGATVVPRAGTWSENLSLQALQEPAVLRATGQGCAEQGGSTALAPTLSSCKVVTPISVLIIQMSLPVLNEKPFDT